MRPAQRAWNAARRLLKEHGVERAPVPIEKIARMYARISKVALGDDISGMLIPLPDGKWVIVLNEDHSPARQRFTLAHELGHLLLHGYKTPHADRRYKVRFREEDRPKVRYRNATSATGTDSEEIEANQFAAAILMPAELLVEKLMEIGVEYDPEDGAQLADVAKSFGVSTQALSIRLSALQLL